MGKGALARRVLADPRLDIYGCGRRDIEAGVIDRRVLATLAFLSASGLRPTVTSLRCGHGVLTSSGNVSEHAGGSAVDIAAVNGIPIAGHQGAGSITELDDPPPADPAWRDEAASDHLDDDLRRGGQHVRHERPRRPHPRRLAASRRDDRACRRDARIQAVDQADRPAQPDRQPGRGGSSGRAVSAHLRPAETAHRSANPMVGAAVRPRG